MRFQIDFIPKEKRATIFPPLVSKNQKFRRFLPIHLSFFGCVNLREVNTFVEKENLHLVKQKIVRIGIGNVQTEMIYQLFLFIEPFLPTIGANFLTDFLTELGR
jgi:hypothetical protein